MRGSPSVSLFLLVLVGTQAALGQWSEHAKPDRPKLHIVGGEDAEAGEFPFVAKIIYGGSHVGCTGSLIAPDKVLTAGHCVAGYTDVAVGFGNTRALEPRYTAAERILHPEYSTQVNDIAILQLENAIAGIEPVRLLNLEEERQYAPSGSTDGVAVGWGSTHPSGSGDLPSTLKRITNIPIYTAEDCRRVVADLRSQGKKPEPASIHERVLCAGEENRAIGQGDSGGPLLVQTPDGWAQVGVLSQATSDPSPQTVVYMGQYTRTAYFLDWIFPTYYLHFAHSARGAGWRTDLVLVNPYPRTVDAGVEVFATGGTLRTERQLHLQGLDIAEWELPTPTEGVATGGVVVSALEKLGGFLRFRNDSGAALSVQAALVANAFIVPVSSQVERVGVAVLNAGDADLTVVFRLGERGVYKTIPAGGKVAQFVDELFPDTMATGALTVRTDSPHGQITVLALEQVGSSLVTLPATPLN